jgi:ion channel POLLUX/CASTOR
MRRVTYIDVAQNLNLRTLVDATAQRGETAIGYRVMEHADDRERGYGVSVNPIKSKAVKFGPHDQIIVLAED